MYYKPSLPAELASRRRCTRQRRKVFRATPFHGDTNDLESQELPGASTPDVTVDPSSALPKVPWGLNTTVTVMICWLLGFYIAAYEVVPLILALMDESWKSALGPTAMQALKHLILDVIQLLLTLGLLKRVLAPHHPQSLGLFALRLRPMRAWFSTVAVGSIVFPAVHWIHRQMVALLAEGPAVATPTAGDGAILGEATWIAKGIWFLVLAICAPLWEEIMFRGFLLPSLARSMAPGMAVVVTSTVFASVHFTKEGFLPLLLLGSVFGSAYLKTKNLLPAIVLHSLWNVCLLTQILSGASSA